MLSRKSAFFPALALFLALTVSPFAVKAGTGDGGIIRDAEIENDIKEWSKDVMQAAGLKPEQVHIILIQSPEVNAFVAGGANIFIYTGLIDLTDNVGQIVGVIAHELGHIEGSHLTRTAEASKNASFEMMLGTLVGIGAAIATGDSNAAAVGMGIGQGQALNGFLAYSRMQESTADQAGLRFLTTAGLDPSGLPGFLDKLSSQELLPVSQQSQFVRTHPLSRDRVETLQHKISESAAVGKGYPAAWNDDYARVKAKLAGFISPQQILYRYPSSDNSVAAIYARAISAYRLNQKDAALTKLDTLIAKEPKNPYFYELKGQILYEYGKAAQSVAPYEKAISLNPDSGLIRTALAQSLIESSNNNPKIIGEAIDNLKRAEKAEPRSPQIKRLLATAYGRTGKEAEARVFLAEEALMQGRKDDALSMAKASAKQLPETSPEALRARDIIKSLGDSEENR